MLIVWWCFFFFFFFAWKQNPSENIENNLKEKAAHLVTGELLEIGTPLPTNSIGTQKGCSPRVLPGQEWFVGGGCRGHAGDEVLALAPQMSGSDNQCQGCCGFLL